MTELDNDTKQKGVEGPFERWEGDHTAFVHVLWSAKHLGLTLEKDFDAITSMLLRSRAMAARTAFAVVDHDGEQLKEALRRKADEEELEAEECQEIAEDARADLAEGGHPPEKADGLRLRANRFDRLAKRSRERAAQLREEAR